MIDERSLLERALHHFEPQPGLTERIYRRRERKRRNERIRAGVVGIVIALIAVLIGTSIVRSEPTPASPHPLPPPPRHADLTFPDDAGIVAIDLASGRRHVVAPGVSAAAVSWSPDGSALVYESTTAPCSVVIRDIETGEDRVLASCGSPMRYGGGSVDWSADGEWIAFSTSSIGGPGNPIRGIVLIHPDGTEEKPVTDTDGVPIDAGPFSLSPDGSAVVFGTGREIHVMNVDGTGRRFLANGMWPDWSTDGSTIAFARDPNLPPSQRGSGDPFVWQFWSILPDGSGLTKLHGWPHCCLGALAAGPVWSPDGAQIAGVALNRLRIIDADGHRARTIPGGTILSGAIAWRPRP